MDRSLGRALVTADTTTQSAAVHGTALPFARFGLRGTVAARFWIYQRREPLSLIYWGIIAIIMVVCSISTVLTPRYLVGLLISGFFGGAFVGNFHANAIGLTGPAFGLEAMALNGRRSMRAYFSGQDLAMGVIAVPLLTAVSFGLAAVAGHPLDGFPAWRWTWPGSARAWRWPTSSPPRWPTRWKSGPATRRPGPPPGTWAVGRGNFRQPVLRGAAGPAGDDRRGARPRLRPRSGCR